jgi:hypothetical protein
MIGLYPPFERPQAQIRLLSIQPAEFQLHVFDLDDLPEYFALSYTWGTPSPTKNIRLNGQDFHIRSNLYASLEAVRRRLKAGDLVSGLASNDEQNASPVYLWIDAMCINQENVEERGHQVNIMSEIFSQAAAVLVWLGSSSCSALEALELHALDKRQGVGQSKFQPFFAAGYWHRMWVIQEFVLAKRIIFLSDAGTFALDNLEYLKEDLLHDPAQEMDNEHQRAFARSLLFERWLYHEGASSISQQIERESSFKSGLQLLIRRFRGFGCEDPRDRIYALLGLLKWSGKRLEADYSLSSRQLCEKLIEEWGLRKIDLPWRLLSDDEYHALTEADKLAERSDYLVAADNPFCER